MKWRCTSYIGICHLILKSFSDCCMHVSSKIYWNKYHRLLEFKHHGEDYHTYQEYNDLRTFFSFTDKYRLLQWRIWILVMSAREMRSMFLYEWGLAEIWLQGEASMLLCQKDGSWFCFSLMLISYNGSLGKWSWQLSCYTLLSISYA